MSDQPVTYTLMKKELTERQEQWSGVLPALLTPDRFLNFALLTLAETPRLFECTKVSLLAGIYQAAKDGLELGRDCYLVPFRHAKTGIVEATYIRDYRGLVKMLGRTGTVKKVFAEVVYEHDAFDLDYGEPDKPLTHRPALRSRGKAVGCYGAIVMVSGTMHVHYMDRDDLARVRAQAPGREQDTWIKHEQEMWRKTALKNACKYVPLLPDVHEALQQEDAGEPEPVGAERAREIVAEMFERSTGDPREEAGVPAS